VETDTVPFPPVPPHAGGNEGGGREGARPFVFARPGAVYVVYLTTGDRFTLDLSADAGVFTARWFDPRAGKFSEAFKVEGSRQQEFQASDRNDWVLHIQSGVLHADSAAPRDVKM